MNTLKKIKTFTGNVFRTEDEKIDYLMNGPDFVGCRHGPEILYKENNEIKRFNIAGLPDDTFINRASLASNIDNISSYITQFTQTNKYSGYSFVSLSQGDVIKIKPNNEIFSFTITNKGTGQYFDFVLYQMNDGKPVPCTYSSRNVSGYTHSGDMSNGNYFLHHIKSNPNYKKTVALGVCGYRRTALHKFLTQNPSIVIVDDENKILYVVPCPLDKASVREDTFAVLATVQRSKDWLTVSVLDRPLGLEGVDTGFYGATMTPVINQALSEHCDDVTSTEEVKDESVRTVVRKKVECDIPQHVQFVQKGTDVEVNEPCFVFGAGLEWYENYYGCEPDSITLSPFGNLKGPSVISLQQSYTGAMALDEVSFLCGLDDCTSIKIHLNDKWLESVVKINDVMINGCIIVHTTGTDVKDTMTKLNISGVSAIAGPLATVLVCIDYKYYWYRGVPNYGITELPEFGDDVTDMLDFEQSKPFPKVYYTDEQMIVWNNEQCDLQVAKDQILNMDVQTIVANTMEIKTLFTQLQVIFDSKQLNSVITEVSNFLEQRIDQAVDTKLPKDSVKSMTPMEKAKFMAAAKGEKRKVQKTLKPLISHIAGLISNQKSQNMAFDLKQLKRRATISDNINKAMTMTNDERMELVSEYSDSVLFAKVNITEFKKSIRAIKDESMRFPNNNLITIDNEMKQIELGLTQELMEVSKENNKHELYSENSIAINTSGIDVFMPFIINNKMITCTDPSKIFWVDECNNEEWAIFRVLMGNTIANSKTAKSCGLTPQNKQVRYMIINMIVTAMEKISESMTEPVDFESPSAQLMRGLYGQLFTTIASGNDPLSMAWQLVMKNSNIQCPKDDMWIYIAVIKSFKFTGWSDEYIINNATKMFAKIIKNKVCGSAITAMQSQISKAKGDSQENYLISRTLELKHHRIFCDIMARVIEEDLSFTDPKVKQWCKNARAMYNVDVPKFVNRQSITYDFSKFLFDVNNAGVTEGEIESIKSKALGTYVRRSACFADSKRGVLDAMISGGKMSEAIEEFKNTRKEIRDRFEANGPLHIQNKEAYKNNDIGRVKGDAEFNRIPWKLITNDDDHVANMSQVFGEDMPNIPQLPTRVKTMGFLEDVRGSNIAIKLRQDAQVDLEAVVDMALPFEDAEFIMNFIGVSNHHETVFNMIENALLNYGDGDRSYTATIESLNAGKGLIV